MSWCFAQVVDRDEAPLTATYALPELQRVISEQQRLRIRLWDAGHCPS